MSGPAFGSVTGVGKAQAGGGNLWVSAPGSLLPGIDGAVGGFCSELCPVSDYQFGNSRYLPASVGDVHPESLKSLLFYVSGFACVVHSIPVV